MSLDDDEQWVETRREPGNPGQRWLAAGAPWRDGMLVRRLDDDGAWYGAGRYEAPYATEPDDHPDLTDDATKGTALGWLREAWGCPGMYASPMVSGAWAVWHVERDGGLFRARTVGRGDTEAEALAAAAERG